MQAGHAALRDRCQSQEWVKTRGAAAAAKGSQGAGQWTGSSADRLSIDGSGLESPRWGSSPSQVSVQGRA